MTYVKMTSIAAALLLGASSLALAQGAGGSGSGSGSAGSGQSGSSQTGSQGPSSGATGSEMQGSGSTQLSEATVRSKLESSGYSNVMGIKRSGEKFEATAQKGGKPVKVFIDAATGVISESEG